MAVKHTHKGHLEKVITALHVLWKMSSPTGCYSTSRYSVHVKETTVYLYNRSWEMCWVSLEDLHPEFLSPDTPD